MCNYFLNFIFDCQRKNVWCFGKICISLKKNRPTKVLKTIYGTVPSHLIVAKCVPMTQSIWVNFEGQAN